MQKSVNFLIVFIVAMLFGGCYNNSAVRHEAYVKLTEHERDSISFQTRHHYTKNYNFVVDADSMELITQQPEEMISELTIDTFSVYKNDRVVVADIRIIPTDSVDSVWIQLANNEATFGWIHESDMLSKVVPDDPISQFISIFSDVHLLIILVFLLLIGIVYMLVTVRNKNVPFVHLRDIDTFYPMLLCLIVAFAATLYASIQIFKPDMWRHFYYHPTLNPFSVPMLLGVFLSTIWAMLILILAVADDVFRRLHFGDAVLYLSGVAAVCAVNYVLFSITTLYYIGYLLFVLYVFFAVRRYIRHDNMPYVCGNCGSRMQHKGRCPRCGTVNE
jgi:hypothetical protein